MARIHSPQIFHLPTDFIQNTQPRNLKMSKSTNRQIDKSTNRQIGKLANRQISKLFFCILKKVRTFTEILVQLTFNPIGLIYERL